MSGKARVTVLVAVIGFWVLIAHEIRGSIRIESGERTIGRLVALGRLSGAVRVLQSDYRFNSRQRLAALHEFGILILRQALTENDLFERCYAATALANLGDWRGRKTIFKALNSPNVLLQAAVIDGLAEVASPQAINVLERFYNEKGMIGHSLVLQAIARTNNTATISILREASQDLHDPEIFYTVRGLGNLGRRDSLPYLHRLLSKATDTRLRIEIAHSMLLLGEHSTENLKIIELGLRGDDQDAACEAALALCDTDDFSAVPILEAIEANDHISS